MAAHHADLVRPLHKLLDTPMKESEKLAVDQFKVITKGMHGESLLPTDEDYAGVEIL